MEKEDDFNYLRYTLSKEYFIDRKVYFKNLLAGCSDPCHRKTCLCNKVYPREDFTKKIEDEVIINKYYEEASENIQNVEKIKILQNGLFLYGGKMILYFLKDERIKDNYISDVKNRALVLESLVNFYFRQFQVLPLPNIIINLDYKINGTKSETSLNLFFEWDGCYLFEGKRDITFEADFILTFAREMKYKINKNKPSEVITNNILIKNNSIVLIDIKTYFPKEKEEKNNKNLNPIIQQIFAKLNYFVCLYSNILKKEIKEIKIILLYDKNRLINYKQNFYAYIEDNKNIFASLNKYELYYDILYIIPSIGNSLNSINQKLFKTNERIKKLEEDNKKIKQIEENDKKLKQLDEINKNIKQFEKNSKKVNNRILELEKEIELIKDKLKQVFGGQNNSIQQSNKNNFENNQLANKGEHKKNKSENSKPKTNETKYDQEKYKSKKYETTKNESQKIKSLKYQEIKEVCKKKNKIISIKVENIYQKNKDEKYSLKDKEIQMEINNNKKNTSNQK